ncbi:MAG: MATE family efflux transporter [Lachnospiraceae bacterium]|nr:MATE family efflux transporter [Lachnospiraceae bacterium]
MNNQNKMAVMPIPKLVFSMSLPIMVSMLVQSLYNIVDGIFVARIDENALIATAIAYSAQMLQIAVAVGTGVGVNAVVSRYLGAKKLDKVNRTATTGLFLTVLSSALFVIWGMFGTKAFIGCFTKDPRIFQMGTEYLQICQLFCTGIFLGTFFQRLLQATGRTFLSMLAQIAGAIVNIIFDPILIFGLFGFPEMGIRGAAIATVCGQWVAALMGLVLHVVQNQEIHFEFKGFRFEKDIIKSIYKVGAPTILMQAMGSIMVAVMNLILGMFTSLAVAFFGVYYKLQSFLFMPMNGLGQGTLPIIGFNYGAKDFKRVKEAAKVSILSGMGIGIIGTMIFMAIPSVLLTLFSASDGMLTIGISGLRIIAVTFVFASATMIIGYIISGFGNGTVNMIATALRQLLILLPAVYLIGTIRGVSAVWFAFWISELAAFAYALHELKRHLAKAEEE